MSAYQYVDEYACRQKLTQLAAEYGPAVVKAIAAGLISPPKPAPLPETPPTQPKPRISRYRPRSKGLWPAEWRELSPKEKTRACMHRIRLERRGLPTDHLPPRVRKVAGMKIEPS